MSSDNDFGGYAPTTPARPPATVKKATGSQQTRAAAPVAGPSKPPPTTRNSRKAQKGVDVDQSMEDVQDVTVTDVVEPEAMEKPVVKTKGKGAQPRGARATTKAAVKSKAAKQPAKDVVVMDDEAEEESVLLPLPARNGRTNKLSKSNSAEPTRQANETENALRRELEMLRREAEEVTVQREKLAAQLEEVFRIRDTETEELLTQMTSQYEARLRSQDDLINEQAKLIAATTSNKPYMLHFLSREAADEEKKGLEQDLSRSKDVIKQKDAIIAEKDQQIRDALADKEMLRVELNAEVERSRSLANRNPSSNTDHVTTSKRGGMSDVADPKMSAVFTLYEDVTNLLVLKVKLEQGTIPGTEEKIFDCIYSAPAVENGVGSSLHFSLRSLYERNPDASSSLPPEKQFTAKMQYAPLDLDKESTEYVDRLDFFNEPFLFQYDQLHVFLKSLAERFPQPAIGSEEEEGEAGETEMS